MRRRTIAAFMLVFPAALALAVESRVSAREDSEGQGRFTFALIGDMPYGAEGDAKFPNVITDINTDRQLSFVITGGALLASRDLLLQSRKDSDTSPAEAEA